MTLVTVPWKGGFPSSQVTSFDRRARDWDYFVSPAHYATPLLNAAFLDPAGATAEVLAVACTRGLEFDREVREVILGRPGIGRFLVPLFVVELGVGVEAAPESRLVEVGDLVFGWRHYSCHF